MISPFYLHGIFTDSKSMKFLAKELGKIDGFCTPNNQGYKWQDKVVESGLALASEVVRAKPRDRVLLVGHSQGGLVCRAAAIALAGIHCGTCGPFTNRILQWRCKHKPPLVAEGNLAVVTIATPNAGAFTKGQMSVLTGMLFPLVTAAVEHLSKMHNHKDLATPRLFEEFENWHVKARYLSISGVRVNRFSLNWVRDLAEVPPLRRPSVRFDVPNDFVVEDSSTDLRQSVIRPEVDLTDSYRHVRAYPKSTSLDHFGVRKSGEVVKVIEENLDWLFPRELME